MKVYQIVDRLKCEFIKDGIFIYLMILIQRY